MDASKRELKRANGQVYMCHMCHMQVSMCMCVLCKYVDGHSDMDASKEELKCANEQVCMWICVLYKQVCEHISSMYADTVMWTPLRQNQGGLKTMYVCVLSHSCKSMVPHTNTHTHNAHLFHHVCMCSIQFMQVHGPCD